MKGGESVSIMFQVQLIITCVDRMCLRILPGTHCRVDRFLSTWATKIVLLVTVAFAGHAAAALLLLLLGKGEGTAGQRGRWLGAAEGSRCRRGLQVGREAS